jgi:Ca-activated chloride channel homolog
MTTQDITPSRLEVAKQVAKDFVKGRFQDRIGLVVFSGEALMLCPLTTDYELLNDFIDDLKPSLITTSGTAIGSALGRCVTRLQEIDSKSRVTILLSDGANTAGNLDPLMAAQLAQAFGIKIYTIAVGTEKTAQTEAVDESTLREIAQKAEGLFFRATDARSLSSIFQRINTLEKIEVNNSSFQNITDYYQMYVRWGIVFVLMAFFCKNTFMGNILED